MTGKLPRLTADKIIKILERAGFKKTRASGSHLIFRNERGRRVTIPCHGRKILHPKVIKSIIRDAELEVKDLT